MRWFQRLPWRLTRQQALLCPGPGQWDLLLATALIYLTGGIDSLFSFLYLLIIVGASVLLPRRDVLFAASAAAILYGSLLDLQYYGYLPLFGDLQFPGADQRPGGLLCGFRQCLCFLPDGTPQRHAFRASAAQRGGPGTERDRFRGAGKPQPGDPYQYQQRPDDRQCPGTDTFLQRCGRTDHRPDPAPGI